MSWFRQKYRPSIVRVSLYRSVGLVLLVACSGLSQIGETSKDDEPALNKYDGCPFEMIKLSGGNFMLGETDPWILEDYNKVVIPLSSIELDGYCISEFPFPGIEGDRWPKDGLSYPDVVKLDALVGELGLRVCTVSELLAAAAGEENYRYPYSSNEFVDRACDDDDYHPEPLGSFDDCESSFGVRDFQVRSSWGRLDAKMEARLDELFVGDGIPYDSIYASWGGTSRDDTYYAPSNFGIHFHSPEDSSYQDDNVRLCADIEADVDFDGFDDLVEEFRADPRFKSLLDNY